MLSLDVVLYKDFKNEIILILLMMNSRHIKKIF